MAAGVEFGARRRLRPSVVHSTGRAPISLPQEIPRYRLTVDDYHRMGEAGILGEDDEWN